MAMIAMTTSNSINVKPFVSVLFTAQAEEYQRATN
jgi:hypothetical protein